MRTVLFLLLVCSPLLAHAGDVDKAANRNPDSTESWLALQRDGRAASPHLQRAAPAERELSYQRWLDSFKDTIPDFYEEDIGGSMSSDSSSN